MNAEIKEILEQFDKIFDMNIEEEETKISFSINECKQILDYITNLQHYYNDNINKYEELIEKYSNLQEENEYLKKHQRFHKKFGNDYIFCVEGDKETYKDLLLEKQDELEDYKLRIDKAVEYLEQPNRDNFDYSKAELLNILNGDEGGDE